MEQNGGSIEYEPPFSIMLFPGHFHGLALFTPFFCGVLKIQTKTTVQTAEDSIRITVHLTNGGTAIAHNLQIQLKVLGATLHSKVAPELKPGESGAFDFEKGTGGVKRGRYPLTVFVDFHDANQYPFSAISGMTFFVGSDVNAEMAVIGKNISMDKKGGLSFDVKNMGTHEKRILATLILPRELSTPVPQMDFQMAPRSQKELDFEIHNFSALSGADYPVFCYFEYDLKDIHHTAVGTAVIKVVKSENLFRRYRWLWVTMAAILIVAFLGLAVKNRRQKSG